MNTAVRLPEASRAYRWTSAGLGKEAMAGNGLDLLTRVIGTASGSGGLISGFAYYEVGKVVFDTWVARGHDVVFAKNTRMEIELAQKQMSVQNLRERVQQKYHVVLDDIRSGFWGYRRAVHAVGGQGVEDVGHRDNARCQRDGLAG